MFLIFLLRTFKNTKMVLYIPDVGLTDNRKLRTELSQKSDASLSISRYSLLWCLELRLHFYYGLTNRYIKTKFLFWKKVLNMHWFSESVNHQIWLNINKIWIVSNTNNTAFYGKVYLNIFISINGRLGGGIVTNINIYFTHYTLLKNKYPSFSAILKR